MTYVIGEPCVDIKDRACVDECPVDCIYEGARMLYIHPDECVDCGACEPVCPVEAIYEDDLPEPLRPISTRTSSSSPTPCRGSRRPGITGRSRETRRRRCRHPDGGGVGAAGRLMPTMRARINRGWAPRGAETSSCSCCAPRPSRAASPASPMSWACTRTVRFHLDALLPLAASNRSW